MTNIVSLYNLLDCLKQFEHFFLQPKLATIDPSHPGGTENVGKSEKVSGFIFNTGGFDQALMFVC